MSVLRTCDGGEGLSKHISFAFLKRDSNKDFLICSIIIACREGEGCQSTVGPQHF